MKNLLTLFLLAFAFTGLMAQEEGPGIKFKETSHNFGEIKEGTQAAYEFKFTNTGDAPLVLKNVKPSCGCTTPQWPKEPIQPGKTGVIKAIYNSKGRPGRFHKTITVTTNVGDQSNAMKTLYIKGNVIKKEKSPVEMGGS